ncbi:nucleotidyltransferase domain-containing protein [Paenibacillus roseipurpureus]|uniref:Nucleotidyltransferase family protein n=1 Tax=Paenibacillus roseopurpureus TaxID=2918901 RepID=A0AA96RKU8_9BACL|nr:hypothetical protein [Paenibacillus sp. MBLB1832]WNR42457.1 hypothetical protein MJB10_15105 [Paenibacillus sp. MBLB1832]
MNLLEPLIPSISIIQTRLQQAHDIPWLIGGSCGLLLQGVDIGRSPRDLDIYVDQKDVLAIHALLVPYAIDAPAYSETPIYASTLSHYKIDGHMVEVVGDFRVSALASLYQVEVSYLQETYHSLSVLDNQEIHLMPLAHEFLFNVLRNRPDRYAIILRTMLASPEKHMPVLADLMARNQWGQAFHDKLKEILDNAG